MTDRYAEKLLGYNDQEGKEDKTGGEIIPILQEIKAEEAEAQDDKKIHNNKQKKRITVKVNGKWCAQYRINNRQNSVIHEKDAYNDITYKYLQKTE